MQSLSKVGCACARLLSSSNRIVGALRMQMLRKKIAPFFLRREKDQIITKIADPQAVKSESKDDAHAPHTHSTSVPGWISITSSHFLNLFFRLFTT